MRLQLTAHGIELTPELREYVQRRIHFALGRFSRRIERLWVRLSEVDGPRVSLDKWCTIRVDAGLSQVVVVSERQDDIHAAVALAVDRSARTVERRLRLLDRTEPDTSVSRSANVRE